MPDDQGAQHIEDAVRASSQLHTDHYRNAGPLKRAIHAATHDLSRPVVVVAFICLTIAWVIWNLVLASSGRHAFDGWPFPLLGSTDGFFAVLVTLMILTSQQHENELSEHRAKMVFELALLNEQKSSHIIRMLDELRRDLPNISAKFDPLVDALREPVAPQVLVQTLQESRERIDETIAQAADASGTEH